MSDTVELSGNATIGATSTVAVRTGRKQIFTNETVITAANVVQVLNKAMEVHLRNRADIKYLEKYLRGDQPILYRTKQYNSEICNKIVVNMANEIVTFKTAEFAGSPIQYISRGSKASVPGKVEKLNDMMLSEGKQGKDWQLAYNMFTCGVGYRLVIQDQADRFGADYLDEAPFEVYIPDPLNTFVVRVNDVTKRVIMGVTYVYLDEFQNKVEYTVYTKNVTYTIRGDAMRGMQIVNEKRHNFGAVTLVEYPCNALYLGAFEVVLNLLDALSDITSNRLDGIEQFIQALMVFEGVDITRDDFLALRDLGAIKLPPAMEGGQSKVYYLNEELDQSQTQTLVDDVYQMILHIVGMPSQGNANTSDSSNNGAMILKSGWWHAEARALETEALWDQSETEFLKVVLKICEETDVLNGLAVSDVKCKFGRHSYEDKLTKTQSFTMLIDAGVPPIQAYTVSGIVTDPEAAAIAFERYKADQEKKTETSLRDELDRERERIANEQNSGAVPSSGLGNGNNNEESVEETN